MRLSREPFGPGLPALALLAALLTGCGTPPGGGGTAPGSTPSAAPAVPSTTAAAVDADVAAWAAQLPDLGVSKSGTEVLVELPSNNAFAIGSAEVSPVMRRSLDRFAAVFKGAAAQGWQARIVGNSDSRGDERSNEALSLARAQNVARHLEAAGIEKARLQAVGAGESDPQATNATRYGRELNRRVDLVLFRPAGAR